MSVKNKTILGFVLMSTAELAAAAIARAFVTGQEYINADTFAMGRAIPDGAVGDVGVTATIQWTVTSQQVNAAIAAAVTIERNRALQAEQLNADAIETENGRAAAAELSLGNAITSLGSTVTSGLATAATNLETERVRALAAEGVIASGLAAEIARATGAEGQITTDYQAAISSEHTAMLAAIAAAVASIRDTTVQDLIPVSYSNAEVAQLVTLVGANRPDGIFELLFTSGDGIGATATVTGLPTGTAAGAGDITYGTVLRVVVDGGVITSVIKVPSLLKQKFEAVDASIAALQQATTPTALRTHFGATGWAKYAAGVTSVVPSTDLGQDLTTGSDGNPLFKLKDTYLQFVNELGNNDDGSVEYIVNNIFQKLGSLSADNGLHVDNTTKKIQLGGLLTSDAVFTGATKVVDFSATKRVDLGIATLDCFSSTGFGTAKARTSAKTGDRCELWLDENGDLNITQLLPNP